VPVCWKRVLRPSLFSAARNSGSTRATRCFDTSSDVVYVHDLGMFVQYNLASKMLGHRSWIFMEPYDDSIATIFDAFKFRTVLFSACKVWISHSSRHLHAACPYIAARCVSHHCLLLGLIFCLWLILGSCPVDAIACPCPLEVPSSKGACFASQNSVQKSLGVIS
jgi:hypothetical protein